MIEAAIFDMDGLLLDSEPLWDQTDTQFLNKRGFNPSSELLVGRLGTGHKSTMEIFKKEFGIGEETDEMIVERIQIFDQLLDKNMRLLEGSKEILEMLNHRGIVMGIATGGHTRKGLEYILGRLEITPYFQTLVTHDEVPIGKPDPAIYLYAARALNVDPKVCLVLEDAPSGIESGKRAGMHTFGVSKIPQMYKKLQEAGADRVFNSLTEINSEDIL